MGFMGRSWPSFSSRFTERCVLCGDNSSGTMRRAQSMTIEEAEQELGKPWKEWDRDEMRAFAMELRMADVTPLTRTIAKSHHLWVQDPELSGMMARNQKEEQLTKAIEALGSNPSPGVVLTLVMKWKQGEEL